MLRIGIISELGEEENLGFARVYFDENNLVSGWLPLPSTNTQNTKHWIPVEVNSQVACLMDEYCEQGAIVMVLWSTPDSPPEWASKNTYGIQFADATEFFYDTENRTLKVNAQGAELNFECKTLNIIGEVNITGDTKVTGDVIITDNISIGKQAAISENTTIGGNLDVSGTIVAAGEITGGLTRVNLSTHMHTTPMGVSGGPVPNS